MLSRILWLIVFVLFFYGTWAGLNRGGEDFRVFHHAAALVLKGEGAQIYANSPDRFLYAPGIAWLLAPLAKLPWQKSFLIWTGLKFLALIGIVRMLSRRFGETPTYLAVLFFTRPFLIEIRYGQVNLFILYAVLSAIDLWCRIDRTAILRNALGWSAAGAAALTKIFPGAVLLIPAISLFRARNRQTWLALLFSGLTVLVLILLPAVTTGVDRVLPLHLEWMEALKAKGFPTETHNQSFSAFLLHAFSGKPFYSLTLGPNQTGTVFGWELLSEPMIHQIGVAFGLIVIFAVLVLAYRVAKTYQFYWGVYLIALLILPLHLVWKPYFVLGIPLVAQFIFAIGRVESEGWRAALRSTLLILAAVMNLTTLDVIGPLGVAYFEAYAGFLWVYLVLIAVSLFVRPKAALPAHMQSESPVK